MKSIFKIVITFILSVLLWNVILAPILENIKLGQTTALNVVSGVVAEKIRSSSKKSCPVHLLPRIGKIRKNSSIFRSVKNQP